MLAAGASKFSGRPRPQPSILRFLPLPAVVGTARQKTRPSPQQTLTSLIYGVDEGNRQAVAASLEEQAQLHEKVFLEFDDLAFWDLGDTGKTALVATLHDQEGHLAALHEALQPLTGRPDRYPYWPHITTAYLQRGTRPSGETLRRLRDRLTSLNAILRVAWLTDRCGLANGYEALGGAPRYPLPSDKNISLP